jgi:hypothetical protein
LFLFPFSFLLLSCLFSLSSCVPLLPSSLVDRRRHQLHSCHLSGHAYLNHSKTTTLPQGTSEKGLKTTSSRGPDQGQMGTFLLDKSDLLLLL